MIQVKIEGKETLERGLKTLKRKFERMGTVRELRRRKTFIKPSEEKRDEVKKATKRDAWIRKHS